MGLDSGLTLRIPRARAKSDSYSFEIIYFRKCYSLCMEILDLWRKYKEDNNLTTEWDGYLWKLKTKPDNVSAHPIFYDIGDILVKTYSKIFKEYPENFENDTIWDIGSYGRQILGAVNQVSLLIMFLEKRIDFADFIEGLTLDEKEQEYIEKYILGHEEEWDFDNLTLEWYYSF